MVKFGKLAPFLGAFLLGMASLSAQIFIDGDFDDWEDIPVFIEDPVGDISGSNVDFGTLKIFDTEEFVFFYIETGYEINLQDGHNIQLLMDTDDNAATGFGLRDLGLELIYNFGNRQGNAFFQGNTYNISHPDIGVVSLPTVTSSVFEIAVRKRARVNGIPIFPGNGFRLLIRNGPNGDYLEEDSNAKYYTFKGAFPAELPAYSIKKMEPEQLRVVSYNVERDGLLGNAGIGRMFQAVEPDIIGFQEIYNTSLADVKRQVETWLPDYTWYASKADPDCILVSKYRITQTETLVYGNSGSSGNGAFLIDDPALDSRKFLIINAHLPCCDSDDNRQEEIDGLMAFIRDCKSGNGPIALPSESPVLILGDLNLVGLARQLETLYDGDILDNSTYGPDFGPDTDGSALSDCRAYGTGTPLAYTWNDGGSSFPPGKLDYILFTDDALQLTNSFALETEELPADTLNLYGLEALDARNGADHIMVVADFVLAGKTGFYQPTFKEEIIGYPNPGSGKITYKLPALMDGTTKVSVHNIQNQSITLLENLPVDEGSVVIDSSSWQKGLYLLAFSTRKHSYIARQIIR